MHHTFKNAYENTDTRKNQIINVQCIKTNSQKMNNRKTFAEQAIRYKFLSERHQKSLPT